MALQLIWNGIFGNGYIQDPEQLASFNCRGIPVTTTIRTWSNFQHPSVYDNIDNAARNFRGPVCNMPFLDKDPSDIRLLIKHLRSEGSLTSWIDETEWPNFMEAYINFFGIPNPFEEKEPIRDTVFRFISHSSPSSSSSSPTGSSSPQLSSSSSSSSPSSYSSSSSSSSSA